MVSRLLSLLFLQQGRSCFLAVCIAAIGLTDVAFAQNAELDSAIARFDRTQENTQGSCDSAIRTFRTFVSAEPKNALACVYLARALDRTLMNESGCSVPDSLYGATCDSAMKYYRLAAKLDPHVRDRFLRGTVGLMISHHFISQYLRHLHRGEFERAKRTLFECKNAGVMPKTLIAECKMHFALLDSNAIYIARGDDDYFPLVYLQTIEGMRTDVSVLSGSYLNVGWYSTLCRNGAPGFTRRVPMGLSQAELDSLEIPHLSKARPKLKPYLVSAEGKERYGRLLGQSVRFFVKIPLVQPMAIDSQYYTPPAQIVFESIVRANEFRRPICFGTAYLDDLWLHGIPRRNLGLMDELWPLSDDQYDSAEMEQSKPDIEALKSVILDDNLFDGFKGTTECGAHENALAWWLCAMPIWDSSLTRSEALHVLRNAKRIPDSDPPAEGQLLATFASCAHYNHEDALAKEFAERAIVGLRAKSLEQNDPISPITYALVECLFIDGRCDEADAYLKKVKEAAASSESRAYALAQSDELRRRFTCK